MIQAVTCEATWKTASCVWIYIIYIYQIESVKLKGNGMKILIASKCFAVMQAYGFNGRGYRTYFMFLGVLY
jgi:hypothetical protein